MLLAPLREKSSPLTVDFSNEVLHEILEPAVLLWPHIEGFQPEILPSRPSHDRPFNRHGHLPVGQEDAKGEHRSHAHVMLAVHAPPLPREVPDGSLSDELLAQEKRRYDRILKFILMHSGSRFLQSNAMGSASGACGFATTPSKSTYGGAASTLCRGRFEALAPRDGCDDAMPVDVTDGAG